MKRVLILHDHPGSAGGAEILALDFRRLLRDRGWTAHLFTSSSRAFTPDEAPDTACRGGEGRWRALTEVVNLDAVRRLRVTLRTFRPDVVHIVMFLTALSPGILRLLRTQPTVWSASEYRAICPKNTRWREGHGECRASVGWACRNAQCFSTAALLPRLAQHLVLQRYRSAIDTIIAPSARLAELYRQAGWAVDAVVPFGVPATARAEALSDRPLIAYAGRLVPEKGVAVLLDAFARVAPAVPSARLLIIGDGPDRGGLERQAAHGGFASQIRFAGAVPRAAAESLLETAWVQVVPSLWPEPFGLVAAEALMRGTAAVVSDQGALPEIVSHGRTGLVTAAGDPEGLSAALIRLLLDRELAESFAVAGRASALDRFTQDRMIDGFLDHYEAVCRGRSAVS